MNKEVANRYLDETQSLKREVEKKFLQLGQRLLKIKEEQLFLATHTSFVEFLWELKMTQRTADKMISIYQQFVLKWNIPDQDLLEAGGWTIVYEIKQVATSKEMASELLYKAKVLSPKDFKIVLTELKTGKPQDLCDHEHTYKVEICEDCGQRTKVFEDEDDK